MPHCMISQRGRSQQTACNSTLYDSTERDFEQALYDITVGNVKASRLQCHTVRFHSEGHQGRQHDMVGLSSSAFPARSLGFTILLFFL